MKIEKFNEEFNKFIKEVTDYLTDNMLNYSCDQKNIKNSYK